MLEWNQVQLETFLGADRTGLVYFYTPMCGTCQVAGRMLSIVEELVEVDMGKMNLNFHPDLAVNFKIESVPCLLLIVDGRVAETIYAFHSVPYLMEKIKEHIK